MIVDNKNFHKKLSVIPLHGDPIEKIIHPPSGLWRGRSWRKTGSRNRPSSILGPTSGSPSGTQGRSRMPLCAVIVIISPLDTENASTYYESRGTQSFLRLCATVMDTNICTVP